MRGNNAGINIGSPKEKIAVPAQHQDMQQGRHTPESDIGVPRNKPTRAELTHDHGMIHHTGHSSEALKEINMNLSRYISLEANLDLAHEHWYYVPS